MVTTVVALAVVMIPAVALVTLFRLLSAVREARERAATTQVAVTDAIHRELGAVVAPTVARRLGGWQLRIAVPFRSPRTVASVLAIAHEVLSGTDVRGRRSFEIVLTPQREAG